MLPTLELPDTTTSPQRTSAPHRSRWKTRLAVTAILLAGVASHLPSLRWGFLYDDYVHQFMLQGLEPADHARPWSLYDFGVRPGPEHALYKWGFFPWWTDPDFKIRFFRPVASLSLALDYYLYHDWAPGYHLTSLAIFAVFLLLAFLLYRALGAPPGAALWALALVALEDNHSLPVGWIANRNTLLTGSFMMASLLGAHYHCRTGRLSSLLLSVCCFLLACGAKESGIVTVALIALYLLLFEAPRHAGDLAGRLKYLLTSRVMWLFAIVAVTYALAYTLAGYGTRSLLYPTPWRSPGQYLPRLAAIIPLAGLSFLFGVSSDVLANLPGAFWPAMIVGVPLLAVSGLIMWPVLKGSPFAAFAIGWMLICLVPEAGADPSDRLLMDASIGAALLIGLFLHGLGPWRKLLADRQYPRLVLGGILVLTGVLLAVPATQLRGYYFSQLAGLDRDYAINADIDRNAPAPRFAFILNSPTSILPLALEGTWAVAHHDTGTYIHCLQFGRRRIELQRVDEVSMILTCGGSPIGDQKFERTFRSGRPVETGRPLYETSALTAIPLAVEPAGIRKVLLRFKRSVDDPSYRFLVWEMGQEGQKGRYVHIKPPAPGQTLEIPPIVFSFPLVP